MFCELVTCVTGGAGDPVPRVRWEDFCPVRVGSWGGLVSNRELAPLEDGSRVFPVKGGRKALGNPEAGDIFALAVKGRGMLGNKIDHCLGWVPPCPAVCLTD